jgi:hypothetical protein
MTCAGYIADGKTVLGDKRMSDRLIGEHLGFAQQTIAKAKSGQMSDSVALALGKLLVQHGVIPHAGEVLMVAHAERDHDPRVRATLMDYAKKVMASVSTRGAAVVAALALGWPLMQAHDVQPVGGEGRF